MTKLRPTCTCCCVRIITFNVVANGPHTHTHIHTHTNARARAHTHKPQSVQRDDKYKILWDINIQTDKVIEVRSPDIVCINKQIECQIIDFAISGDRNIGIKEQEKIDKYQVLIIELQKV